MNGTSGMEDRNLRRMLGASREQLATSYDEFLRRVRQGEACPEGPPPPRAFHWGGVTMAATLLVCASIVWTIVGSTGRAPQQSGTPAQDKQDVPADVERLIEKLGADDQSEREDATRKLIAMGERVAPFMREALKHKDVEVASRARRVLDEIYRAFLDLPEETRAQLAEIERRIAALREGKRDDDARALDEAFQKLRREILTRRWAPDAEPELHMVGLYEPKAPTDQSVTVRVTLANVPVVLVLCSYEQVYWKVELAEGVSLRKVVLGGYEHQEVEGLPKEVRVERHVYKDGREEYFGTYSTKEEDYPATALKVKRLTGLDIMTFQGMYQYQGTPFVLGDGNQDFVIDRNAARVRRFYEAAMKEVRAQRLQALEKNRFWAVAIDGRGRMGGARSLAQFTVSGPVPDTVVRLDATVNHVVVDPASGTTYGLDSQGLVAVDAKTGKCTRIEQEKRKNLPTVSWASGLALDTKRGRLLIVTFGGEGDLYSVDPAKNAWTHLGSLDNRDFSGLVYVPDSDCFYAVGAASGERSVTTLTRISADGALSDEIALSERIPADITQPLQVAVFGRDRLVLVAPPATDGNGASEGSSRCYVVDVRTGKVEFTTELKPK